MADGVKHKTLLEKITDALGFTPAPPGELTEDQLDYIISQIPLTDISGKVDKEIGKSLLADSEALKIHSPGSDNQDLSGLQPKETGKGLSTNDYSDAEEEKLGGIETGAVSLNTVKSDSDIADAISKKHSNFLDHSNSLDHSNNLDHSHSNKSVLDTYDQTNINITDAVNKKHSNSLDHSNTWKCGIATKNINDVSTVQNIAHGLGRIPMIVRVTANCVYSAALSQRISGCYDGTNHSGISLCLTEGTTTATIDNIYSSTAAELGFTALGTTNPYTGTNRQTRS